MLETLTRVPRPGSDSISSTLPWDSTMVREMDSPIPVPCSLVVRKGSNRRLWVSWSMPQPLSLTARSTKSPGLHSLWDLQ